MAHTKIHFCEERRPLRGRTLGPPMEVDVAIVGGGPAGCSTALSLIAKGYSVAIVSAPNGTEKPTETAAPVLKHVLCSVGAEAALSSCEPCFGISSDWGRPSQVVQSSIMNPLGHSWFIHRTRFDLCLQHLAREAGAIWIEETAHAANFKTQGICLHTRGMDVHARWLVAATGSPVWAARVTQQAHITADSLLAFWTNLPTTFSRGLLLLEATDQGWWYLCPDEHSGVSICFVTDTQCARRLRPAEPLSWNGLFRKTALHKQLGDSPLADSVRVASISLATLPKKYGQFWTAVGDAAAKLDPLGSSGTITAVDSGQRAGAAIADAIRGESAGLERYGLWSNSLFEEFLRQRNKQYAIEASKRHTQFWFRRVLDSAQSAGNRMGTDLALSSGDSLGVW
jgi:flavin-dependent dehydrogenase